ncbi:hypothetical protein KKA93_03495 [Patescibacteria group bacterium]|nr:hypothetical protein [Patescibacteria group bacterium]MBU1663680.1 hypothetical protein [Patescibacteria group bacterium]MBU1933965.1 hypothetical protein [Patescibacteria group bacterium]MBU2007858.1 hypothetical protein [Patescibacteria group bacterium]MBU2233392.1 hypothetical protein [Patescibacteria group bacterium]
MHFEELRKKIKDWPIFKIEDILKWFPETKTKILANQLYLWTKKGYIQRIKRNLYKFSEFKINDHFILANFIYPPCYISLETALNYYGIVPDIPQMITLITPLTTRRFKTDFGNFFYHHIKKDYFFGWRTIKAKEKNCFYNVALPEKALLDFIYFNSKRLSELFDFKEERFEFDKNFDWAKFLKMSKIFKNKKVQNIALKIKKFYAAS